MSSHRLSASGDRQYSLTAGGGQFTSMQVPAKQGDGASVSLNSFDEISFLAHAGVDIIIETVEVKRTDDSEPTLMRVVTLVSNSHYAPGEDGEKRRAPVGISFRCKGREDSVPHTNIDIRKETGTPGEEVGHGLLMGYGEVSVVETITYRGRNEDD